MSISLRQVETDDDYQAIRVLLQRSYELSGPPDYCTVGDLDWWCATDEDPAAIQRARIWLDGDIVVGFAWPTGDRVDHIALPTHQHLEPEMVRWAEEAIRADGTHATMTAFACGTHGWRQAQLEGLGFQRGEVSLNYWHRTLDELPEAIVTDGYVIRNLNGTDDVPERVDAHREAFAPSKMTVEKHLAAMRSPTYRHDLDLVAVTPDGTIAAYCTVWFDEFNRNGVFEPVGCRTAHQRRGLTRAVMFEGMRRLRHLGARTAVVVSSPTEEAANRLYASAGFSQVDVLIDFEKQLT